MVSGQSAKRFTARKQWVSDRFQFLKSHLLVRAKTRVLGQGQGEDKEQQEEDNDAELPVLHEHDEQ